MPAGQRGLYHAYTNSMLALSLHSNPEALNMNTQTILKNINHPPNELWATAISLCPPQGYKQSMKALPSLSSLNGAFMRTLYLHL